MCRYSPFNLLKRERCSTKTVSHHPLNHHITYKGPSHPMNGFVFKSINLFQSHVLFNTKYARGSFQYFANSLPLHQFPQSPRSDSNFLPFRSRMIRTAHQTQTINPVFTPIYLVWRTLHLAQRDSAERRNSHCMISVFVCRLQQRTRSNSGKANP